MNIVLRIADHKDQEFADKISLLYQNSSKERGTGIALRTPEYLSNKMQTGHAIICFLNNELAGFCYIETFSHGRYVSNSGLIVVPEFRSRGLASKIKQLAFSHARNKYPDAKVFGITTSNRVMEINSKLGYIPVSFQKLTDDDEFWAGCKSCPNYSILENNRRSLCLCTGMLAPSLNEISKNIHPKQEKTVNK